MLGVFTDQAYNLILLAEDEARMLGQPTVGPEHLLLAFARCGNVERLLRERGVSASEIRAAIVRAGGLGDELVLGRVPRSRAVEEVLEHAVDVAAQRGVAGPSSEHVLLALGEDERALAVLREAGITDVRDLVDGRYPARAPFSGERVKKRLLRIALNASSPPRPGPIPPVFERYTAEARRAVRAAYETAALLEHHQVEPLHLVLGCLCVPNSLAATVVEAELAPSEMGTLGEALERARMYGPRPAHQATGIFTEEARRIVSESALAYAYRHDHSAIGTGHLLLATLDARDQTIGRIVGSGVMSAGPMHARLARALTRALPGQEHPTDRVDDGWISFDMLIRLLTDQFRAHLPPGWVIRGSGRSGGFHLQIPDSRSEADFVIDMSWILTSDHRARERLLEVTQAALVCVQAAVVETTSTSWPAKTPGARLPEPHAGVAGDAVNPRLRLWYGPSEAPVLELEPQPLINMIIHSSP